MGRRRSGATVAPSTQDSMGEAEAEALEGRSDNGTFDSRLDGEAEALASRTGSDT